MSVLDTKFVQGFIRMCNDGWEQGWHERNGGNLSYRIKDEEVAEVKEFLHYDNEWKPIATKVPGLASEYFLVTGSGKYFRNVIIDPEFWNRRSKRCDQRVCPWIRSVPDGRCDKLQPYLLRMRP